jgi:O-acetyl-ADP-ribose deacetylase (regulator of RNase III)
MRWRCRTGDILDLEADVLIVSANVFLTLSGGVGGAFRERFGVAMQAALDRHLSAAGVRHVSRGDVIPTPPCGSPFRAVLHAVAVDGLYDSTPTVITEVVTKSLLLAADLGARTVALPALATGYGRLSLRQFASGLSPLLDREFPPVEKVIVGLRSAADADEIGDCLPALSQEAGAAPPLDVSPA